MKIVYLVDAKPWCSHCIESKLNMKFNYSKITVYTFQKIMFRNETERNEKKITFFNPWYIHIPKNNVQWMCYFHIIVAFSTTKKIHTRMHLNNWIKRTGGIMIFFLSLYLFDCTPGIIGKIYEFTYSAHISVTYPSSNK
jgi:hypothetical protein